MDSEEAIILLPEVLLSSLLAGLATVLGGMLVLFFGQPSQRLLAFLLGVAAGVMLSVVTVDLIPSALGQGARWLTAGGFACGVLFLALVDNFLSRRQRHRRRATARTRSSYIRLGLLVSFGIALHDLPEGLAIGAGFAATYNLGTSLAFAIGLHNVPEGISMAAPLLLGGWSRWRVMGLCLLVALVTPLGTWLSLLLLSISPEFIAASLAFAAGAMVFVVADELIPTSHDASRLLTSVGLTLGFILILIVA